MTPSSRLRRAVALTVVSIITVACNAPTPLTQGPKLSKDQGLRVQLSDQPQTLDPGQTQYPYETAVLRAVSEPLLKPTADLNGVTPAYTPMQGYPAVSRYAVGVGGTVLYWNDGGTSAPSSRAVEYTWNYTGGGSSNFLKAGS